MPKTKKMFVIPQGKWAALSFSPQANWGNTRDLIGTVKIKTANDIANAYNSYPALLEACRAAQQELCSINTNQSLIDLLTRAIDATMTQPPKRNGRRTAKTIR